MWLSTYLKEHGINFTGSETDALDLEFDKHDAKQRVIDAGFQSPKYFIAIMNQSSFNHDLTFPLFVKPANRGSSEGVDEKSVVYTQSELEVKILHIHNNYSSDALVEEYLPGREFSVAVIRQPNSNCLLAMPIELVIPADTRGNSFLSEAVKHIDSERVSAVDDLVLKDALNSLATGVFRALGARDYGRIDLRLEASGAPSFMEANLTPGLSNHGYFSRCFYINEQIDYNDMILGIAGLGLERVAKVLV
jgi:D-alanine-D-alanine ligase